MIFYSSISGWRPGWSFIVLWAAATTIGLPGEYQPLYRVLFYPPSPDEVAKEFGYAPELWSIQLDVTRLLIQWVAVAIIGILLLYKDDDDDDAVSGSGGSCKKKEKPDKAAQPPGGQPESKAPPKGSMKEASPEMKKLLKKKLLLEKMILRKKEGETLH